MSNLSSLYIKWEAPSWIKVSQVCFFLLFRTRICLQRPNVLKWPTLVKKWTKNPFPVWRYTQIKNRKSYFYNLILLTKIVLKPQFSSPLPPWSQVTWIIDIPCPEAPNLKRKYLYFLDFGPLGWDIAILSFLRYPQKNIRIVKKIKESFDICP